MLRTLIIVETGIEAEVRSLLAAATQLHGSSLHLIHALNLVEECQSLVGLVDCVHQLDENTDDLISPRALLNASAEFITRLNFDQVLIPASRWGTSMAARLAVRLDAGLVTDVKRIEQERGKLRFLRSAFGGKHEKVVELTGESPIVLAINHVAFQTTAAVVSRTTEINEFQYNSQSGKGIRRIGQMRVKDRDVRDRDILISGGRGVGNNFDVLQILADALGGQVSASRAAVDAGLASKSVQVGQSGKRVSPRLYMALGIHGAMQHVAGLQEAEHIISVNMNVNAPICSLSDIVVEGDALTFANKLLKKIKEEQSNGTH